MMEFTPVSTSREEVVDDNEKPKTVELLDANIPVAHDLARTPTFFVDGAQGYANVAGIIKFNIYNLVQDSSAGSGPEALRKVIAAQLVMTPATARNIGSWLVQRALEEEALAADGAKD